MRLVLVAILVGAAARGEYLRIEQPFGGTECASCTEFVIKRLTARAGVESAVVDPKGAFVVTLKPGNAIRLRNVVDLVQQSGFKPGETLIVALGTLIQDGSPGATRKLKVTDGEPPLLVTADPSGKLPAEWAGAPLRVEGNVVKENGADCLRVRNAAVVVKPKPVE